jgi:type IV secretory pathway TrbF-like protein
MALTVRQLISKLRKMPPEAIVVWQDHDQAEGEYNDFVGNVADVTDEFAYSFDPEVRTVALRG